MRFTFEQKAFKDLLTRFSHVVANEKSHVPQLSHVKIEVRDNQIIFTGTDLEIALVEVVAKNEGDKVGQCTVPVKSLLELVKNLSSVKPVTVELVDDKKLRIKQGSSQYSFMSTDPTIFPTPELPLKGFSPISPESLVNAIESVDYAVFPDDTRGALGGILLEPTPDEGFIRAVASDGRRMATCKTIGVLKDPLVLSKKGAISIKKIVSESEEASILANDKNLFIALDNSTLIVRLLASAFPNYQAAFPQGGHHLVKLERDDTINLLKRISLFAGDKTSASIRMTVGPESIEFKVNQERGSALEELKPFDGSEIKSKVELLINPYFLQQALEKLKDDLITVRIYSDLSPILIFDKENTMALVMPQKK